MRIEINIQKKHLYVLVLLLVFSASILVIAQLQGGKVPDSKPSHPLKYVTKGETNSETDKKSVDANENSIIDEAEQAKLIIDRDGKRETHETFTSLERYKVSISTSENPFGLVKIDNSLVGELCGDEDGCEVRFDRIIFIKDPGASTNKRPERWVWSGTFYYYYNFENRWRFHTDDTDSSGLDSDDTERIVTQLEFCIFTDAETLRVGNRNDDGIGFGLYINSDHNPDYPKSCSLTFID